MMYSKIRKAGAICALVSSLLVPVSAFAADSSAYNAAVRSINGFAFNAAALISEKPGDFFFSPFSVIPAVGMVYAGAKGDTAREMEAALSMSPDIHKSIYALTQDLTSELNGKNGAALLTSANRVWLQDEITLRPEFNSILLRDYRSTAAKMNFKSDPDKSKKIINLWVEQHTNNRIRDLIQKIEPDTKMILTNAVYFMGSWAEPFNKNKTKPTPFHVTPSDTVEVPMMMKNDDLPYGEVDGVKLLRLSYRGRLSMLLALPDDINNMPALLKNNGLDTFNAWRKALSPHQVDLWLPKFKVEKRYELKDMLKDLGIRLAFENTADFSGITDDDKLKIDSVIHQTFIEVDEKKTEAAAATSITMVKTTAVAPRELPRAEFHADRPFLYFIVDDPTGTILFMGRQCFDKSKS